MKTTVAASAVFAFLIMCSIICGACGDDDRSSLDAAAVSDVTVTADAAVGDATAGDMAAGDATAGDAQGSEEYCPVVGYTPCGGDLIGTWVMLALCPEDPVAAAALCEHPYDNQSICTGPGNEAVCDGTPSGTLTFEADGTLDIDTQISLVATYSFTDECLQAAVRAGTTAEERCLSMNNDHLTCTYEEHCTCVSDPMIESDQNTATYTIEGQDLIIGEDPPATWCVDGDRLTMDYYLMHPVSWRYWVLERQ
jgi:hypothetical protein